MPKIDAPTVAEHHSRRRAALIDAGIAVIAERGVDALTLGAVGAVTGLARSSVYQYFDSSPALIAAIVEGSFPAANDRLRTAVARASTPGEQVDAYVRTAIDLATDRTHRSLHALATADLPAECRARLADLHQEQYAILRAAVAGLGITDPELTTRLLVGIMHAAAQEIVRGASRRRVTSRTLALIHQGLDGRVDGGVGGPPGNEPMKTSTARITRTGKGASEHTASGGERTTRDPWAGAGRDDQPRSDQPRPP